jgi:uridine phosphorylase
VRSTASRSSAGEDGLFATTGKSKSTNVRRALAPQREVRPNHLKPATALAERVLLPGDPHRALAVAQRLLEGPKMFNHHRGLWGYTGVASDGEPLTIQSTGMGGPSAAIVVEELIALGARRLVRIGTCGALARDLELGALLAVEAAIAADGTSVALGAHGSLPSDPKLLDGLTEAGAHPATVASTDLFYDPREGEAAAWLEAGAVAVEMEAATIFTVARRRGILAACVLGVTDVPGPNGSILRATPEDMDDIGLRVGNAGYAALAAGS